MSRRRVKLRQDHYANGWVPDNAFSTTRKLVMPTPNSLAESINFMIDTDGSLVRRPGLFTIGDFGSGRVQGLFESATTGGIGASVNRCVAAHGGRHYVSNQDVIDAAHTWTDLGTSGWNEAVTGTTRVTYAEFRIPSDYRVVYVSGTDCYLRRINTNAATISTPGAPAATTNYFKLAVYNRRLFGLTADPTNGSIELHYSDLDDGDTLGDNTTGGGIIVLMAAEVGRAVSLAVVGDSLLILHDNGVSVFTGWSQDDISIQTGTSNLDSSIGCNSRLGTVVNDGWAYFWNNNAMSRTNGRTVESVSEQLNGALSYLPCEFGVIMADERMAFKLTGYNELFIYNNYHSAWEGRWSMVDGGAATIIPFCGTRTYNGFAIGDTNGEIWLCRGLDSTGPALNFDDSTRVINASFKTGAMDGGEPFVMKAAEHLQMKIGRSGNSINVGIDNGDTTIFSHTLDAAVNYGRRVFRAATSGNMFEARISVVDQSDNYSEEQRYGACEVLAYELGERGGS